MCDLADEVGAGGIDPQVPMMPDEKICVRMDNVSKIQCCLLHFRVKMVLVAKFLMRWFTVVHVVRIDVLKQDDVIQVEVP